MRNELVGYIKYLERNNKSKLTVRQYNDDLTKFVNTVNKEAKEVTTVDIENYISTLAGKSTSINKRIAEIKGFFKYMWERDIITKNPAKMVEKLNEEKRLPKFLTLEESKKAIENIESIRDKAIILIFIATGIRISELVTATRKGINEGCITVIGKGDKERQIPLTGKVLAIIKEYLKSRNDDNIALFVTQNGRISKEMVHVLVKKYCGVSAHKLRHTCATLMYENGVDLYSIKEILGYENITTTQIYTHVSKNKLEEAVNKNPINF